MSILKPAKILGAGSGDGSVTVENITDATDAGKSVLLAANVEAIRTLLAALGNTGDQTLDGTLTITDGLIIRSPNQTVGEVISFQFGEDDGVIDVAIRATATPDNHGQLALGVRDSTNNVVNAITIDGNGKQIMVLAGYKLLVGPSGTDISKLTPFGGQLLACQDAAAVKTLLGITG
ncbi:MAG: hypothetical protein ACTINL_02375 [Serratia proteamaculans]